MNLFVIAGYLVVSIIIYSVLTKLAAKSGRLNARIEKGIAAISLIWPLWGELAIIAIVGYVLLSQKSSRLQPRQR